MHRVPECLSFRQNWVPPLSPQASVAPPQDPSIGRGGGHSLTGEGGSNSNEGTETLALHGYYNPSASYTEGDDVVVLGPRSSLLP
jgi:hypothetical protein